MPKNLLLGQCLACRFEDKQMVPFVGPIDAKLAVVGEYNGREEFRTNIPFTGQAGQVLDGVLEEVKVPRDKIRIGNAVLCGPLTEEDKEADWFPEVVDRCSMRCAVEKDLGAARVVVALGGHAALSLLGHKIIMGGRTPVRGSTFRDRDGRIVIPTWNPAAILRAGGSNGKNKLSDADVETIGLDIRKAWDLAYGTVQEFKPVVQLESDPAKFVEWVRGCGSRVSIDVETSSADPLTCKLLSVGLARRVRPHPVSPPQDAAGCSDAPIPAPADAVVEAISFWWPNANEECREALMWLLEDESVTKTFHNCLTGDSRVWMADGTKVTLAELVRKRHPGPVLSFNQETGRTESRPIVNWVRNEVRVWDDWLRIRVCGKGCLRVTRDHEVMTSCGWKRADKIVVGDRIQAAKPGLLKAERDLIFGSLLGDMSLTREEESRSPRIVVAHEHKQYAYLQFKRLVLQSLAFSEREKMRYGGYNAKTGTRMHTLTSKSDARLALFERACLLDGKRTVSREWLDNLTPPALAIWFCDDGCVSGRNDGDLRMSACVTAIGMAGGQLLVDHLRSFGWNVGITVRKADGQLYLYVTGSRSNGPGRGRGPDPRIVDFWTRVAPYVPVCMAYKLPVRFRHLASDSYWISPDTASVWFDDVVEVGPLLRKDGDARHYGGYTKIRGREFGLEQYCLEVEGNHNFYAEGLLVKNCQFDVAVLSRVIDCRIRGPISDTLLLSHARFPDCRVDLGSVAQTWLALPAWKASYHTWDREREKAIEKAREKGYTVPAWPEDRVLRLMEYNAWDVAATAAAEPKLVEECEKEGVLIPAAIDVALARIAWKMTHTGVYIDQKIREEVRDDTDQRLKASYDRMQEIVRQALANPVNREAASALSLEIQKDGGEFNPYNQTAMPLALDVAGVEVKAGKNSLTATGKRATNKKALAEVSDHPLVAAVFAYKGYYRQKSNFFEKGKLDVGFDHRLHMPWKIHGTPTGRWSSGGDDDADDSDVSSVNLQNWPGAMRKMVVASAGNVLAGFDFAQLEYRVIALLAGEKSLLDLFNDPAQPDLHSTNAARLFGAQWDELDPATTDNPFEANRRKAERKILRGLTKNGLYGAMYKGSAATIQVNLQSRSLKESDPKFAETLRRITKKQCQSFVDAIPRLWPSIETWRNWAIKDVEDNQCTVSPLSGRRRVWPLGMSEATQAVNTRVQTFAGDVMNDAFLKLSERLPPEAKIILQVHDSVVVECPEAMGEEIKKLMVETATVDLPLNGNHCIFSVEAKVGHSWAEV